MTNLTTIQIKTTIPWPWQVHHSAAGKWIGVCQPLKLTLQAETRNDLMVDIDDTLKAIMKDLLA